jgi:hypothetical protein
MFTPEGTSTIVIDLLDGESFAVFYALSDLVADSRDKALRATTPDLREMHTKMADRAEAAKAKWADAIKVAAIVR